MSSTLVKGVTLLTGALLAGGTAHGQGAQPVGRSPQESRPVVVQGAMDLEVRQLASRLDAVRVEKVGPWTFWCGTLDGSPVIVSKTMKGLANAAAATAIAAERYRPAAILNQGTAGGHDPDLHVYDIVLGMYSVSLGAFKSAYRKTGEGSNPLEWRPLDLLASESSAGEDLKEHTLRRFPADERLLGAAKSVKHLYRRGRVVEGVIGSAEVWNDELDRIRWFRERYGTSAEEMETAAAAQIASFYQIPFLGIRVLSDNITNGGAYDPKTGEACQEYVYQVVKAYVSTLKR
jgi:adenosylhomocysteine nucleosidase